MKEKITNEQSVRLHLLPAELGLDKNILGSLDTKLNHNKETKKHHISPIHLFDSSEIQVVYHGIDQASVQCPNRSQTVISSQIEIL
jgi:hypothetical protein